MCDLLGLDASTASENRCEVGKKELCNITHNWNNIQISMNKHYTSVMRYIFYVQFMQIHPKNK